MPETYRRIVLASRPRGWVVPDNFRIESLPVPEPADGEVAIRNHYLSLDPYMRAAMDDVKSYRKPQRLGETMVGGTVGRVERSRNARFPEGSMVVGSTGWAEYAVSDGRGLTIVDTSRIPAQAYLGAVGMPGMTAWYGFYHVLRPKAGETLVVSAASGAVGSVVGQLAKAHGVRAVGIAGGSAKCEYVTSELGFDACIDYKDAKDNAELEQRIRDAAPGGVDAHFENVGGDVLNAVISQLNPFARVAICGLISDYNAEPGQAPRSAIVNPRMFLVARFSMRGFVISDHLDLWPTGLAELQDWVVRGQLKYRESVAAGLEAAPEAFIGMLNGRNFGKQLVRLI